MRPHKRLVKEGRETKKIGIGDAVFGPQSALVEYLEGKGYKVEGYGVYSG
jgi:hypothetical protein